MIGEAERGGSLYSALVATATPDVDKASDLISSPTVDSRVIVAAVVVVAGASSWSSIRNSTMESQTNIPTAHATKERKKKGRGRQYESHQHTFSLIKECN